MTTAYRSVNWAQELLTVTEESVRKSNNMQQKKR